MSNVTFLFGAGASAEALPIVSQIPTQLEKLIITLDNSDFELDDNQYFAFNNNLTKRDFQKKMISYLRWLAKLINEDNSASVGTLAKKLFLQRKFYELTMLKLALSVFFVCEQAISHPDKRYDSFFSSILKPLSLNF